MIVRKSKYEKLYCDNEKLKLDHKEIECDRLSLMRELDSSRRQVEELTRCKLNEYDKIRELLNVFEDIESTRLYATCTDGGDWGVCLSSDMQGRLITTEHIMSFRELLGVLMDKLNKEQKMELYNLVMPLVLKYETSEMQLRDWSRCMKDIVKLRKTKLKRKAEE